MHASMLQLTPTQRDIYLEGKHFGGAVNNIGGCQKYFCALDTARFARARQLVLDGNDAYRLRFREVTGGCEPLLTDRLPGPLPIHDHSGRSDAREVAREWILDRFRTPFDDLSGDVFEDALIKVAEGEYWYFAKAHHLIMDGWGFALQMQRCIEFYAQLSQGSTQRVAAPSFVDYMGAQAAYHGSASYAQSRDYWLAQYDTIPRPLFASKPAAGNRPPARSSRTSTTIAPALFHALDELARRAGTPIVSLFQTALYVYFSRAYGCDDLVICSPVHNRRTAAEKSIIGALVNVNATRFTVPGNPHFSELLRDVAQWQRRNYRHGRFPMGDLVRALRERHPSWEGQLHQVAFNYQKLDFELGVDGHAVQTEYLTHDRERTPLTFVVCDYGEAQDIALHLDYRTDYFDAAESTAILDRLHGLLGQLAWEDDRPIGTYRLPTVAEADKLLGDWSGSTSPLRRGVRLHQLFEEQVARTPDAIAVACGDQVVTYEALDAQASRVARRLGALGVGPERFVGVCHSRTPQMLAAILGILKSGAAYVPLDPAYPAARIQYILGDAGVEAVLADGPGRLALPAGTPNIIGMEELLGEQPDTPQAFRVPDHVAPSDANLAYVIYTSGSTGNPKGVLIEHRQAAAFVQWALETFSRDDLAAVLAATSVCFDLSVFEMFVPLAMGGRVVLVDNVLALRGSGIADVTLVNTVPSAVRSLLEALAIPRSVRCINLAGELLRQDLVDALYELPGVVVNDLYGPSEDTTYSTWCRRERHGHETIGRPIANTQVYVLDHLGGLLPPGLPGELHIAGAGLARGYLNQPALTDEKFIVHPLIGKRLYRTGDLVRFDTSGNLQYSGRIDNQVKVRGFRVELGEIEAQINRHPGIGDCAVVARDDAGPEAGLTMVGYLVAKDGEPASDTGARLLSDDVIAHLSAALPAYMVPSTFVVLPELPLTANGKFDRKALPAPGSIPRHAHSVIEPRSDVERRLQRLWATLLPTDNPGIQHSFFACGGDSLLLMRLATAIEREFAVALDLSELFACPTIEMQATLVDQKTALGRILGAVRSTEDESRSNQITL
ncbi:non-ribosomal peptide synthetase [Luteibacter sp. 9135]|uniref:non-ribosomal peptide synthetase n=1 Tax=Luteibacter sp. 9135 TaxID=1500893 RepID=UPI001639D30F|nr:non-ribosomal peptide synthetase [Luteibacter sp. 9135]